MRAKRRNDAANGLTLIPLVSPQACHPSHCSVVLTVCAVSAGELSLAEPVRVSDDLRSRETRVGSSNRPGEERSDFDVVAETTTVDPPVNAFADTAREPARGYLPPQIIGEKCGRIYFLDACEVEYLASAGNYVVAHQGTNEYLSRATLKGLSVLLAPLGFI